MKTFLIALICFALGFGSSYLMTKEDQSNKQTKKVIKRQYIKPEIHDHSLHEKEMDEMLEKAKGFYEKAFKLFLMSLGAKLNSSQQKNLASLINDPQDFVQDNEAIITNDNKATHKTEIYSNDDLFAQNPINMKEVATGLKEFQDSDVYGELRESLRGTLKDPSVFYAKSKYEQKFHKVQRFNGQYFGKLYILTGEHKGKVDLIDLDINYTLKDENDIDGSFSLKLIRNGEVYSDSNGRGGNRDLKLKNGQLIIDVGPNCFFHFKSKKIKVANYYQNGKLIGTAFLNRK